MELRHLRYFVEVAEKLSFSRAAVSLRVTQPALSRQIRDLEQEFGCSLLRRGSNVRTELTPEGSRLLKRARALLAEADAVEREMKQRTGKLRIGHYGTLWLNYFTPALRRFAKTHPDIGLQPVDGMPGDLPELLRRGEIDVALIGLMTGKLARDFHSRRVAALPALLAMSSADPRAKKRKIRLGNLTDAEWVSWDEKAFPGRKQLLLDACRAAGFRPKIVHETDSIASLFARVATGGGIGHVLPMSSQLPHEGVVFVRTDPPDSMVFEMHILWRHDEPRTKIIAALLTELAAPPGGKR